jgi:hypothetical protein
LLDLNLCRSILVRYGFMPFEQCCNLLSCLCLHLKIMGFRFVIFNCVFFVFVFCSKKIGRIYFIGIIWKKFLITNC